MPNINPRGSDFIGSGEERLYIDIEEPRWEQSSYLGRLKHFCVLTDVRNIFASSTKLEYSRQLVEDYRRGVPMDNTTVDELWRAKYLYDSAYHPDTGEKVMVLGRMSACAPVNMILSGAMLTFRKTVSQIIFWQWVNQSVMALINYSNRSGRQDISLLTLVVSYACATTTAVGTALEINKLATTSILERLVPFAAIVVANAINIPIIRSQELIRGTEVFCQDGRYVGKSRIAGLLGIFFVYICRIAMIAPAMMLPTFFCDLLDKQGILSLYPRAELPLQAFLSGFIILFSNPMCCAIFPQKPSIAVCSLERDIQDSVKKMKDPPATVKFNRGL